MAESATQLPPVTVHLLDCGWVVALPHVTSVHNLATDADGTPVMRIYTSGRPDPITVRTFEDRNRFHTAWERWEAAQ